MILLYFISLLSKNSDILLDNYRQYAHYNKINIYYESSSKYLGIDDFYCPDIESIKYFAIDKHMKINVFFKKISDSIDEWNHDFQNDLKTFFDNVIKNEKESTTLNGKRTKEFIFGLLRNDPSIPTEPLKKIIDSLINQMDVLYNYDSFKFIMNEIYKIAKQNQLLYIPKKKLFEKYTNLKISEVYFFVHVLTKNHQNYITDILKYTCFPSENIIIEKVDNPDDIDLIWNKPPDNNDNLPSQNTKPKKQLYSIFNIIKVNAKTLDYITKMSILIIILCLLIMLIIARILWRKKYYNFGKNDNAINSEDKLKTIIK
ncbi:hypothetical protein NUSPORA_00748 [Nucleospora cyclopteri]